MGICDEGYKGKDGWMRRGVFQGNPWGHSERESGDGLETHTAAEEWIARVNATNKSYKETARSVPGRDGTRLRQLAGPSSSQLVWLSYSSRRTIMSNQL